MGRRSKPPRNHVAKELWTPKFRPKVENSKKKDHYEHWTKEQQEEDAMLDSLGAIFSVEEDWD